MRAARPKASESIWEVVDERWEQVGWCHDLWWELSSDFSALHGIRDVMEIDPIDFFTKAVYITAYGKGAVYVHYAQQEAENGPPTNQSKFDDFLARGDF